MKNILLLFLLAFFTTLNAQEHGEVKWIEGVKYVYHKVDEKETLYGLSKQYGIEINEILINNPEAIEGLQPGMLLRIPQSKKKEEQENQDDELRLDGDHLIHVVKPKETLYSLARQYEVTQEELKEANDLSEGLKVGMSLKIPIKESFGYEKHGEVLAPISNLNLTSDSTVGEDLRIALLLPLYLDLNDIIEVNKEEGDGPELPPHVETSLAVYGGVYLAMDSLKSLGYKVSLNTFDTEGDSVKLKELMAENDFSQYDLIVGPMKGDNYKLFAESLDSNVQGVLCPFNSSSKVLDYSKNVIKAKPNREAELKAISSYLGKHKTSANIVLVYESTGKEDYEEIQLIKKELTFSSLKFGEDSVIKEPAMVNYRATGLNGIISSFQDETENIVVIVSENPSFVTQALQKLEPFTEDFTITVFGKDKWRSFKTFEPELFDYLDVHLSCKGVIDYQDSSLIAFQEKYFDLLKTEPSTYAIQMFDQILMLGKALGESKGYRHIYVVGKVHEGLFANYKFSYTGPDTGIENKQAFVVRFVNYKFIRVDE